MSYIHVGAKISTFMHLADASTQSDVRQRNMRKATKLLCVIIWTHYSAVVDSRGQ